MKNITKITMLIIIMGVVTILSCKKEDNSTPVSSSSPISSIITSGMWHVSYFNDHGSDHTSSLSGYTFSFNSNGQMSAANASGTTTGTWTSDDSHNEIHINIGNSSPLTDISKGWLVTESSSTVIKLKDNSSNDEVLHFTKN